MPIVVPTTETAATAARGRPPAAHPTRMPDPRHALGRSDLLALQRTAGNRAVAAVVVQREVLGTAKVWPPGRDAEEWTVERTSSAEKHRSIDTPDTMRGAVQSALNDIFYRKPNARQQDTDVYRVTINNGNGYLVVRLYPDEKRAVLFHYHWNYDLDPDLSGGSGGSGGSGATGGASGGSGSPSGVWRPRALGGSGGSGGGRSGGPSGSGGPRSGSSSRRGVGAGSGRRW